MIVRDDIIANATEGDVLRFTLALWELEHGNLKVTADSEASSILGMSKNAFVQHKEGKGSIGIEGWEKLGKAFDLRAYDIWLDAKRKQYRRNDNA